MQAANSSSWTGNGPVEVLYLCAGCGQETRIKPQQNRIKCEHCHSNMLYKKRTKKVLCFEAR